MSTERDSFTIRLPECSDYEWARENNYQVEQAALDAVLQEQDDKTLLGRAHIRIVGQRAYPKIKDMVYEMGRFFWKEFDYDCPPGPVSELGREFLFWKCGVSSKPHHRSTFIAVGACAMNPVTYTDGRKGFELSWVWLHPFERDKGNLSLLWPYLRKAYGDFWVQQPLSSAMDAFLTKKDYHQVLDRLVPDLVEGA